MTMKLYFAPGACSLSVHIALREAGVEFEPIKVDLRTHKLKDGTDYYEISPRGYVPLIELDDGSRHTEAAALLQYVGDLDAKHLLIPAYGTPERFQVVQWLAFVSTELHKVFSPWLWHKETADSTKEQVKHKLAQRFTELDKRFAKFSYLTGEQFTVADAYCFTIANWSNYTDVDLSPYANLKAYMARVAARPKVYEAMKAEHLIKE